MNSVSTTQHFQHYFIFEEVFQHESIYFKSRFFDKTLSQDFSTFLHKFYLIIDSRAITDILLAVHQRKPTQK